jgi:hypothetical protein
MQCVRQDSAGPTERRRRRRKGRKKDEEEFVEFISRRSGD